MGVELKLRIRFVQNPARINTEVGSQLRGLRKKEAQVGIPRGGWGGRVGSLRARRARRGGASKCERTGGHARRARVSREEEAPA